MRKDLIEKLRERLSDGPLRYDTGTKVEDVVDLVVEVIDDDLDYQMLDRIKKAEEKQYRHDHHLNDPL